MVFYEPLPAAARVQASFVWCLKLVWAPYQQSPVAAQLLVRLAGYRLAVATDQAPHALTVMVRSAFHLPVATYFLSSAL